MLLGIQPITTDLYLPALPGLAAELGSPMTRTQLTLSALLFAFGFSQLFLGPIADRFGRRPVLLGGLVLYVVASLGAALAPGIDALVLWRAVQGVGMGAAVVCARAMVRDLYVPTDGARVMSKALSGLGLIALASPLIGGAIASWLGWRTALLATGIFGAATLALVALRLPETARALDPHALRIAPMFANWWRIARHPSFVAWSLLVTCTYAGLLAFLASSSFVFIEVLGTSRMAAGMFIAGCSTLLHRRHLPVPAMAAVPRAGRCGEARRGVHAGRRRDYGWTVAGRRRQPLGHRGAAVHLQLRPRRAPALRPGGGGRPLSAQRRCGVGAGRLHPGRRRGARRRLARRGHGRHGVPADADGGRDVGGHSGRGVDAGAAPRRSTVRPQAICLAGPTASGKSALALQLAEALRDEIGVEIISVDSAQVYRGMDIGTAKPGAGELARMPHHLIDILEPEQAYSAARFVQDARRLIDEIRARGRLPLLVGGTMLYFKVLRDGIDEMPAADHAVRAAIDARAAAQGWPALHAELQRTDPVTAARLAPNDAQRIQRALEVWAVSGRPLSSFHRQRDTDDASAQALPLIALEPASRAWLHERIAQRFDSMLAAGLLDEVRALRATSRPAAAAAVDALRRLPPGLGRAGQWPSRRPARDRHRRHAAIGQAATDLAALDDRAREHRRGGRRCRSATAAGRATPAGLKRGVRSGGTAHQRVPAHK